MAQRIMDPAAVEILERAGIEISSPAANVQELVPRLDELGSQVAALRKSNAELLAFIESDGPDDELTDAMVENVRAVDTKRAAMVAIMARIRQLGHTQMVAIPPPLTPVAARPPAPVAAPVPAPAAVAAGPPAEVETDGGLYL